MEKLPYHIIYGQYISEKSASKLLTVIFNFPLQAGYSNNKNQHWRQYFNCSNYLFLHYVTFHPSFSHHFEVFSTILWPQCRLRIEEIWQKAEMGRVHMSPLGVLFLCSPDMAITLCRRDCRICFFPHDLMDEISKHF